MALNVFAYMPFVFFVSALSARHIRTRAQPRPARTFGSLHAPVSLLDAAGTVVVLPFSHTLSFARYCAQHGVQRMRRFCVSRVFRHDVGSGSGGSGGGGGGKKSSAKGASGVVGLQPRESLEASFDAIIEAGTMSDRTQNKNTPSVENSDFLYTLGAILEI